MPKSKGEKKIEIPRGIPKDWASRLEAFYKVSSKDKSVSSAPLGSEGLLASNPTPKIKESEMSLGKLESLWEKTLTTPEANGCCWKCGRKAKYIYLNEYGVLGFSCGYHQWEKYNQNE